MKIIQKIICKEYRKPYISQSHKSQSKRNVRESMSFKEKIDQSICWTLWLNQNF